MKKSKILVLVFKNVIELFLVLGVLFQAWFTHTKCTLQTKYQELLVDVKQKELHSTTEEMG